MSDYTPPAMSDEEREEYLTNAIEALTVGTSWLKKAGGDGDRYMRDRAVAEFIDNVWRDIGIRLDPSEVDVQRSSQEGYTSYRTTRRADHSHG